jgi:hypothetical protein
MRIDTEIIQRETSSPSTHSSREENREEASIISQPALHDHQPKDVRKFTITCRFEQRPISETIMGTSASIASETATGKPSWSDENTKTSSAARIVRDVAPAAEKMYAVGDPVLDADVQTVRHLAFRTILDPAGENTCAFLNSANTAGSARQTGQLILRGSR